MPTKLEDIPTPRSDAAWLDVRVNCCGDLESGIYRLSEKSKELEKELHVAREKLAHEVAHWKAVADYHKGLSPAKLVEQLATANQKCQLVDELVKSAQALVNANKWPTPEKNRLEINQRLELSLSKAAKTL